MGAAVRGWRATSVRARRAPTCRKAPTARVGERCDRALPAASARWRRSNSKYVVALARTVSAQARTARPDPHRLAQPPARALMRHRLPAAGADDEGAAADWAALNRLLFVAFHSTIITSDVINDWHYYLAMAI